jgi:hypothetical protein
MFVLDIMINIATVILCQGQNIQYIVVEYFKEKLRI